MPLYGSSVVRSLARCVVLFVIVVSGVWTGFFVSVKSGLTERLSSSLNASSTLPNSTTIRTGQIFPPNIPGVNMSEFEGLDSLLSKKKTIVAFVSTGCNTCEMFLNFLSNSEAVRSGEYNVQLYSADPEQFTSKFPFPCMHLRGETEVALALRVFPTIVGVDKNGRVRFVSVGFRRELDEQFLKKNL